MSQFDFGTINPDTKSGTQLANDLNNWRDAIHSMHRGPSRPSYAVGGTSWIDDAGGASAWQWKIFDGDNADILVATIDTVADTIAFAGLGTLANLGVGSSLRSDGSNLFVERRVSNITTATTVPTTHAGRLYRCNASAGAFSLTLPNLGPSDDGFELTIIKNDLSVNKVTVEPDGTDTINGYSNWVLSGGYEVITIRWYGSSWHTISGWLHDGTLDLAQKAKASTPNRLWGTDALGATILKGAGVELLESFTSGWPVSSVDFTVGFSDASYVEHLILARGLLGDNAGGVLMARVRVGGAWQTGAVYDWTIEEYTMGQPTAASVYGGPNTVHMQFAPRATPISGSERTVSRIWIASAAQVAEQTEVYGLTTTQSYRHTSWNRHEAAQVVDGFRLFNSTGNLTAGAIYHYGIRGA